MDETQPLEDRSLEKHEPEKNDAKERGEPLAKLRVFKNDYCPETELPLYLGNNVLGRDPTSCSLVLSASSVSKCHAVISLSVFPGDKFCSGPFTEALLWDLGSLNGTRKGRFRLTPNVRYALSEGEYVVLADVPCQYVLVGEVTPSGEKDAAVVAGGLRGRGKLRGRGRRRGAERKGQEKGRSDGEKNTSAQDGTQEEQRRSEATTPNPARTTALALEQTPARPRKLIELASESDTDDDGKGRRDDRRQVLETDSDSPQPSGPTCSTFLSPANNVVPESEDENPVTPAVKNVRTGRTQNSGKTEEKNPAGSKRTRMPMGGSDSEVQESLIHTMEKKANENDTDMEENAVNGHQCGNIKVEGGSETNDCGTSLTANVPALAHDAGPAVEGKGEKEKNTSQHEPVQDGHCKSTGDMPAFHMDSDTDIEGEQEVGDVSGTLRDAAATSVTPSTPTDLIAPKVLVTQPDEIRLDSDTDVEDNEGSFPTPAHVLDSSAKGVSAPQVIAAVLHLDSNTDSEGVTECPTKSEPVAHNKSTPSGALLLKPQELDLGSDTDAEDVDGHPLVKSQSSPLVVPEGHGAATKQQLGLEIQSDSDSEAEEDSTHMFTPLATAKLNPLAQTNPELASSVAAAVTLGPRSGPSADTSVEDQGSVKPCPETQLLPKSAANPIDCNLESDTDVEDEEDQAVQGVQEANVTPKILRVQNCSTPLSSDSALPSLLNPKRFTDDQDEDKDDDFVVAETQAFLSDAPAESRHETDPVLDATQLYVQDSPQAVETSAGEAVEDQATQTFSFQMGLSNSSHKLSMSTRLSHTLASMEEQEEEKEVEDLEAVQIHRDAPASERTGFVETDGDLEATQAYGGLPLLVLNSPGRVDRGQPEGGMELGFHSGDPQQVKDEEGGEETQAIHFHADSHLSTADTQPVSAFETRDRGLQFEEEEAQEGVTEPPPQNLRGEVRENEEDVQPSRSRRGRRGEEEEGQGKRIQPAKRVTRRSSRAETKQEHPRRGKESEEGTRSNKEEDEAFQDQCNVTEKRKRRRNTINLIQEKENNDSGAESVEGMEREEKKRLDSERKEKEEKDRLQKVERENETMEREEQTEEQERESLETEKKDQEVLERQEGEENKQLKGEEKERGQKEGNEREEKELLEEPKKEERGKLEREGEKREGNKGLEREENPGKDSGGGIDKEAKVGEGKEKLEKETKEDKRLQHENKQEKNQKLEKEKNKEGSEKHKEKEAKQETDRMLESEKQKRKDEGASEETVKRESEKELKASTRSRRKSRAAASSTTAVKETTGSGKDMVAIELEPKTDRTSSIASASSTICNFSTGMQKRGRAKKSQGRSELDPDKVDVSADRAQGGRGSRSQTVTDSEPMRSETEMMVVQDGKAAQHSKAGTSKGVNRDHKGCDPVTAAAVDPASTPVLVKRSRGGNKSEKLSDLESAASEPDQTAQSSKVESSKPTGRQRCRKRGLEEDTEEKEEDAPSRMVRARRISQKPGKMLGEKAEEIEKTEESEREKGRPSTSLRKGRPSIVKKVQPGVEARDETKEEETGMVSLQRKVREWHRPTREKNESGEKRALEEEQNKETALGTSSEDVVKNCEKTEVPQTPPTRNSRKRTSANESPATPKMARRSPGHAVSTLGTVDQNTYKVLFTGLTDDQGETTVLRLGGSMAKGVSDMTHLVTDKVRRTVKFLCAVARGIPVVTTAWLEKCGKSAAFLSPSAFLVKDVEQEKKFNFCLEESLRVARAQPLLQGYEIHVTRSVKPEPSQMKDIISCSGARYLPKMPTVQKPKTVVISCEEDASLCGPALSASLPVLSAEFLLSGILQQKVDLVTHALTGPCFEAKSAPRGRNRK
ncbi:mediator of DNA damage checkpoint protein 1-like [Scleropages formosus]|uniref:Mediator of DNA damage checkpoint protein 1 n=1 Tax=Scleropages formosus TaxID=113540 RepID=A0A0P7XLH0_SCLFO|nr:mediator of DNA damage checkpoint protein 1-like [Scleropages formosus]